MDAIYWGVAAPWEIGWPRFLEEVRATCRAISTTAAPKKLSELGAALGGAMKYSVDT
jgi:hypothetical protein